MRLIHHDVTSLLLSELLNAYTLCTTLECTHSHDCHITVLYIYNTVQYIAPLNLACFLDKVLMKKITCSKSDCLGREVADQNLEASSQRLERCSVNHLFPCRCLT